MKIMRIKDYRNQMPRNGTWHRRTLDTISYCTIHHDAVVRPARYNSIERYQNEANFHITKKGWPGIGYHYKVDNIGDIYFLNDLEDVTWHDKNNYDSVAVCCDGYFHTPENQELTEKQEQGLRDLLDYLRIRFPRIKFRGHREAPNNNTACPGDILMRWLSNFKVNTGGPMTEQERIRFEKAEENIENAGKEIQKILKVVNELPNQFAEIKEMVGKQAEELNRKIRTADVNLLSALKGFALLERSVQGLNEDLMTEEDIKKLIGKEVVKYETPKSPRVPEKQPFLGRFLNWVAGIFK